MHPGAKAKRELALITKEENPGRATESEVIGCVSRYTL